MENLYEAKSKIAAPNITKPEFRANPFPFLAQLRAEAPVYRMKLPSKVSATLITRYEDVNALLKDERFAKNPLNALTPEQQRKQPWIPPMFRALSQNMLDLDAPDHTRLRGLVHKGFTPRLVEQMRARVQSLADELLDKAEQKGSFDLIADYALPIPMTIITEILGVPAKDHAKFHNWSSTMASATPGTSSVLLIGKIVMFIRYLNKFIKMRRKDLRDDLVSALIQAEDGGETLSDDELLAMILILLIAGHETTVNLIGSGSLALLQNPTQLEKLRADPSLAKSAVEELLRYTSPVMLATERYAREDITLHGVTIPRGELTLGVLASANHDENVFVNPDSLDITRENNKHLAFGQGAHYCVGSPLARLEGQIAFNTLLSRLPNLRLKDAPDTLKWRSSLIMRGLESLPVVAG